MRRGGFTLVELAVVLSVLSVVVPAIFVAHRGLEEQHARALATREEAAGVRTVGEALHADARNGRLLSGEVLAFEVTVACKAVEYRVNAAGALVRAAPEACGGSQALAVGVTSLRREPGGARVSFADGTGVFFALEGAP